LLLLALGWSSFSIWIFYSLRFLEEIRGLSTLVISAQIAPVLVTGLLAAGSTGFLMTHAPVAFTLMVALLSFFVSLYDTIDATTWIESD
jgi:hypothetical protein